MATEFKSSACPGYEALLEDRISGELGGTEGLRLSAHLKDCAGCRAALESAAFSPRLLHLAEPAPDPGPGFDRLVMARIRQSREVRAEKSFWQPLISLSWRIAATATLALAVLVAYDATLHNAPQPNVAEVRAVRTQDLFSPDPTRTPANRDEVLMMVAEGEHGKR